MKEWEKLFDDVALARAKAIDSGRIVFMKRNSARVEAAILASERTEVSISFKMETPTIMKCQCPKAKSGRNCEHMAAVLYKLDKAVEEQNKQEKSEQDSKNESISSIQDAWNSAISGTAQEEKEAKITARQEPDVQKKEATVAEESTIGVPKKRGRKSKAQLEAERLAAEEAEKQAKKEATEKRIAERKALKAAQKAERKQKRAVAEAAQRKARQEEAAQKEEELKKQQEAAARKKKEEEEQRKKEEMAKKAQEEEAARKKEEKVKAAIDRKKNASEPQSNFQNTEPVYQYYDINVIKKELQISPKNMEKGQSLLNSGKVQVKRIETGYYENMDDLAAQITATAESRNRPIQTTLTFTRDKLLNTYCNCPDCRNSYAWYTRKSNCAYMAAVVQYTQQYLETEEIGDATDKNGAMILTDFQRSHTNQIVSNATLQEETLMLTPRLNRYYNGLRISFKISTTRSYVIKDIAEFCEKVRNSEKMLFGSSTELNLNISNFTAKARQWYDFMNQVMQEEEELIQRIESITYRAGSRKCPDLELYGWRMDRFCELLGESSVEYEDKSSAVKEKLQLTCKEGSPKMTMRIRKSTLGKKKEFHGIDVLCNMPQFYYGTNTAYFIQNNCLYKTDICVINRIKPLLDKAIDGRFHFQVGRNKLTDFYYSMLPQLEDVFDVMEEDSDEIHKYLPPEVEFVFYLDAENHDLTCHVAARYGDRECSVIDVKSDTPFPARLESFRVEGREREIFFLTKQLFPYLDRNRDLFCCNGEEDYIYEVMSHGVETLAELGEVKCTDAFRKLNIVKKMRMTVGVSVSSGLLDMEIETEGVSREELLDVLKGYKLHKKYYRLKSGDFINLEDENLQMLKELMETMHLSPKEFIKGKVHLPIYRTLYLDKLLEEKEGLYTNRDQAFRSMVKNFKTISDADYEVPSSLSRIMRGYQKNGFQWMKTLESCQFGGILADDMGLGKTLQAISFLLSAKNRGTKSLVVAPASLVFNWGEEFARFAPELSVQLITGDQQERQSKIEEYQNYDICVTSYDLLRRDISYYEGTEFYYAMRVETQHIKN